MPKVALKNQRKSSAKRGSSSLRLDHFLALHGVVASRRKAQALIMGGHVSMNEQVITKSGQPVKRGNSIVVTLPREFVSRGAYKLAGALAEWPRLKEWLSGKRVMDLGASTGGFCQVLLQHGAARVVAVDVGYGQLHPSLVRDGRVDVVDRTNARIMLREKIQKKISLPEEKRGIDFFTSDMSFISFVRVAENLREQFGLIPGLILVKPQFELEASYNRKGVVTRPEHRLLALCRVVRAVTHLGWGLVGLAPSSILGPKGNQEFLLLIGNDNFCIELNGTCWDWSKWLQEAEQMARSLWSQTFSMAEICKENEELTNK